MNCLTDAQILRFLDGDPQDPRTADLREHIRQCGDCARRVKAQQALFGLVEEWNPKVAPPPPLETLWSDESTKGDGIRRLRFAGLLRIAASLLLSVGAGALLAELIPMRNPVSQQPGPAIANGDSDWTPLLATESATGLDLVFSDESADAGEEGRS